MITGNQIPLIKTDLGQAYIGDVFDLIHKIEDNTVQLIVTSPPFSKENGHSCEKTGYSEWITSHLERSRRVLRSGGFMVIELGGNWKKQTLERTVDHYEIILNACNTGGWHLLQVFYWYNPRALKMPDSWDESRPGRFRECISTIFWLACNSIVQVDIQRVRSYNNTIFEPYGNLVVFSDASEDLDYREACASAGLSPHFDPFPTTMPSFFISLLTDPSDLVLDPFAGSLTTGAAAEKLGRKWICFEKQENLIRTGIFRFESLRSQQ